VPHGGSIHPVILPSKSVRYISNRKFFYHSSIGLHKTFPHLRCKIYFSSHFLFISYNYIIILSLYVEKNLFLKMYSALFPVLRKCLLVPRWINREIQIFTVRFVWKVTHYIKAVYKKSHSNGPLNYCFKYLELNRRERKNLYRLSDRCQNKRQI
jgi:hypothetical protein